MKRRSPRSQTTCSSSRLQKNSTSAIPRRTSSRLRSDMRRECGVPGKAMTETTNPPTSSETTTARAYGAQAADASLESLQIERRALGPKDVRIDIRFCGVCHSDIHYTRGEWGEIAYP